MITAQDILRHAAGELDICPRCEHTGRFGTISTKAGKTKRCPKCGTEQIDLVETEKADMKKTALIAVDVQNDFLPGGALPVEGGDAIIHPLTLVARDCDLVIASRDWHPPNHLSFRQDDMENPASWLPHCIQDTKGARIHPKIRKLANYTISKGMDPMFEAYSAFAGHTLRPVRTLEEILRDQGIQQVIVGGPALDYCVRWTALDANALGFDTVVPLDCTRAFDAEGRRQTLEAFEKAGVRVVDHWSR